MSSQPHVELRAVGKRFGRVEALTRVSLAIRRGEVHALVGENGAGKSTLGKLITGALRPDAGTLLVAGRAVSYRSPRQALEDGITLLAQERLLVQTRSIIENVFLGVEPGWGSIVARRRLDARYAQLSERTGFDLPARTAVRDLGAANQQKVEVMRALARGADLIVMDEPTAGLTRDEATKMLDIVRNLKSDGATVVLVSHALEDVVTVADTVSVLRDGEARPDRTGRRRERRLARDSDAGASARAHLPRQGVSRGRGCRGALGTRPRGGRTSGRRLARHPSGRNRRADRSA